MAVKTNITINIVEPGSDVPVPDTGLFTHGIGNAETTIIVSAALVTVLVILSIVLTTYMYRKHKKQGRTTKLVHIIDQTKAVVKSKKRITIGLSIIALLVSACTFTAFMLNTNKSNTSAIEGNDTEQQTENTNNLTINAESKELTIEVKDQPVFAVLPVQVTVEEATQAGYTLTAYTDNTDLVSTTNPNNKISMVALPETAGELSPLTDNTYGLALGEEPTSKDEEVYTTLSTDQDNPTIIKSMAEYSPTEAEDKTTIYYGFYITPDIPYGTYTNDSEVHYDATINTTLVTFDGNDLYFDGDEGKTTNEVEYIVVAQEESEDTINQIISGEYKEPSQALPYNFLGWSEEQEATTPTYTSAEDIVQNLLILPNQPIILYAIWQKATTITYDANGGTGTMTTQTIIAGESDNLYKNTFTRDGYTFTGWNTVAEPTEQDPGKIYADKELYQAETGSANVTLFAQWKKNLPSMQDVATWGSTLAQGDEIAVVDSRDGKEYTVARLKDGNIWMTQNLDLVGGTKLYSETSDVPEGYPESVDVPYYTLPVSSDAASSSNQHSLYNTPYNQSNRTECTGDHPCYSYYSWIVSTAGSVGSYYEPAAPYSICPKGWKLPSFRTNDSETDYYGLLRAYGIDLSVLRPSGNYYYVDTATFMQQAGPGTVPNFLVSGTNWVRFINEGIAYWSSSYSHSSYYAARFVIKDGQILKQQYGDGGEGWIRYAVRCIAR